MSIHGKDISASLGWCFVHRHAFCSLVRELKKQERNRAQTTGDELQPLS
jgi:hypothetical protein